LLKSFTVPLICDDSSDDESRTSSIQLSTFVYVILEDTCYFFCSNSYRADIRCAHSQINDVPRWKSIVAGEIYNDEELLKSFRIPRNMFAGLAQLL
jgi:hypothetical protein